MNPINNQINVHSDLSSNLSNPQILELEKVCTEFVSLFSSVLIKGMRSTMPQSSLLPGFQGKKLFDSMVDQNMAEYLSFQNAFGLKESLLKHLLANR